MSSVLLPVVETGGDKAKITSNPAGSNQSKSGATLGGSSAGEDFSSALAQFTSSDKSLSGQASAAGEKHLQLDASEASEAAPVKGETASAVKSHEVTETDPEQASSTEPAEQEDDLVHVLAQINLANQLNRGVSGDEQPLAAGGESLPPEASDDESHLSAARDRVASADSKPAEAEESVASDKAMSHKATRALLEQLTPEQLDSVVNLSGLQAEQLAVLPAEMLQQLIDETGSFTHQLQTQTQAQSPELPTELMTLIQAAHSWLSQDQAMSRSGNLTSQVSAGMSPAQLNATSGESVSTASTSAAPTSSALTSKASVSTAQPSPVEAAQSQLVHGAKAQFLGESKLTEGQVQASQGTLQQLKTDGAAPDKSEQPTNTRISEAQISNARMSVALVSGELTDAGSESPKSDVRALQSVSGLTLLRPEAPAQYQLSLKPQGETAQQMQEMIQKFSPVMRQQLLTMVNQGVQQAEIRLDPPELGQMMVRIQVQGDQTQVQFHVTQHQTRDLVEQAIPRLREMLNEQGLQLSDSHVSQGGSQEQAGTEGNGSQSGGLGTDLDEISTEESLFVSDQATSYRSGIDYYA